MSQNDILVMVIIIVSVLVGLLIFVVLPMLIVTYNISKKLYFAKLVRTEKNPNKRECSCVTNEEHLRMFNQGMEFAKKERQFIKEVSIKNDGLKLVGELFDYGKDKTVIISPGRCETIYYSYYFAEIYKDSPYNVLVIDPRAHGLSEGKYPSVGVHEGRDLNMWAKYLKEEHKQSKVYIHGLCIGAGGAFNAAALKDSYIDKLVVEGPFKNFYENFKEHTIEEGHCPFPVCNLLILVIRKYTKANIMKNSPYKLANKINIPLLYLQGRKDKYSLPKHVDKLFGRINSENKKLIWFMEGSHSHLRINNLKEYDEAVLKFLGE